MWARHRLEWVTAVVAAVLGAAYLVLPRMGSDLAAQTARAEFFADHGYTPIDLRWYAGVDQLGYSLLSQPVMALLGVRVTGALSLVLASVLIAALFRRTGAPRPWLGALAGTVGVAGNLVSGRVTYGLGIALALAALLLLTHPRWRWLAAVPALLASATSPVAGLFLGLAGVALLVTGRWAAGVLIAAPAAVPLGWSALFLGDGGWMNISTTDTLRAVVSSLAVALLVPRWPVRAGGVLSALGVLAAAMVHTPVGLNATRLAVMFTLPLLAGYAALPRFVPARPGRASAFPARLTPAGHSPAHSSTGRHSPAEHSPAHSSTGRHSPARPGLATHLPPAPAAPADTGSARNRPLPVWGVALLLVVACWWQPPVVVGDVRDAGNPTAQRAYFAPLLARLSKEHLTGRVDIPSTRDYWEAAYLGDVPLARGWLRQADIDRNPLFFSDIPGARGTGVALTPASYRAWLSSRAVQFVAVPDAELTWSGRPSAQLINAGLPYLAPIWSNEHWRLYAVADPQPIVPAPATLVSQTATTLTFDVPAAADLTVRVHHYSWLRASGGALVQASGEWTLIRLPAPGRYTLTSGF
nr:hypothetical protein [uncultured Actinoplanes sp.]